MRKHEVKQAEEGTRLDQLIRDVFGLGRSVAKTLIEQGDVEVDGENVKPNARVQEGQTIAVLKEPDPPKKPTFVRSIPDLDILYEDEQVLVLNKQPGVLVHEAQGAQDPILVDALLQHHPEIQSVGDDPIRPGIVHRLDKDVSGVMIVAKTQKTFEHLKAEFQERRVEKEYLALVHGNLPRERDTIRLKISRSRERARMVARPESQEGKDAVTHYELLERFKHFDYIRVQIETGRTHQIRAHFHALGYPLAGDRLYFLKKNKPFDLNRIFLHAHQLTVTLPNKTKQTFTSELPAPLREILAHLPKT